LRSAPRSLLHTLSQEHVDVLVRQREGIFSIDAAEAIRVFAPFSGPHPRLNGCIPPRLVACKGWLLLKTNTLRTLALRPINVNQ
jgi:hypothetical protein